MIDEILNSTKILAITAALGGGILSFFIGLLMERYKNRSLELMKTITFQKIGIPTDSYLPGELHVTYNGNQVNSLYLFKLEILNNSNFDSKELPINFYSDVGSYVLSYSLTWIPDTTNIIPADSYNNRVNIYNDFVNPILAADPTAIIPEPYQSEGLWLHRNRMLLASSINRKEEIELTILIGSQIINHQPILYLQIPAPGINLVDSIDPINDNEKVGRISMVIGIVITLILGTIFTINHKDQSNEFIIISIVGALNFILGIAIYKLVKFIHAYFK